MNCVPFFQILILAACLPIQSPANATPDKNVGTIQGRVVDAEGKPIEGAKVFWVPRHGGIPSPLPTVMTNSSGEFLLLRVAVGINGVVATKEGDGYPDSSFGAFAEGVITIPEVKVEAGKTTSGVLIELKKGGVLAGIVSDSETGKPLAGARLLLERDDDPRLTVSTRADIKGRFQLDLPAKPFNIRISQPGYATWENGQLAPHPKGPPLVVEPGSRRELAVVLKRTPE